MKNKTVGMIILSVLLLMGGVGKQLNLVGLISSFRLTEMTDEQIEAQVDQALMVREIDQEDEVAREGVREMAIGVTKLSYAFQKSGLTRFHQLMEVLLGWMAIASGIGILLVQNWGRLLVLTYAYISLPLQIIHTLRWNEIYAKTMGAAATMGANQATAGNNDMPEGLIEMIFQGVTGIALVLSFSGIAIWYGIIIWYFNRKSMKDRFAGLLPEAPEQPAEDPVVNQPTELPPPSNDN